MTANPGTGAESTARLLLVMSEHDLVERAQDGDLAAFEALYRDHVARVFGLCLRMVANRSQAEELAQDAFVRAWEKLPTFRGKSAFSTWLHRLTVNVVLGDRRSRSRREDKNVAIDQVGPLPSLATPRGSEVGIDLERAIAALPERARTVFVLHDVEGYRHSEIAKLAGMAEGTSKAHLHRARQLLREALRR